jgi:hypothetical protein
LVASLGEIPDDERQVHFEVPLDPSDAEISAMLDMLAEDSSNAAPAGTLVVRLSQKLVQPWIFRDLSVFARNALAESINLILLLMSRKRKRDVFGEYLVWIGTLVLQFLLLRKYLCLNLLTLTPMGVIHLSLIPMGVLHLLLIPMGVLSVSLMKTTGRKKMRSL